MTTKFNNVYVGNTATIASVYEKDGPIADYFDLVYDKDLYYGCDTFERAEEKILHDSIGKLISKSKLKTNDIDLVISGDLQNQIAASDYAMREFDIPFLGIFNSSSLLYIVGTEHSQILANVLVSYLLYISINSFLVNVFICPP